jgi:iron complex transport system ATP-binding protein
VHRSLLPSPVSLVRGEHPAALAVTGLSWGPAADRVILQPLDFTVAPGEILAVVGPNGAGKSTLLRCLYRYHRPLTGSIQLDGKDIWQLDPRACARRIATVVQETASDFGLTVFEIAELGRTPHGGGWAAGGDDTRVLAALDMMGLRQLSGREFSSLSGGEKQRAMIARGLVQSPGLLILDEPTNHLDIRHQLEVLDLLRGLGITVIVSLHDLALASSHADRVLVLDKGRMLDIGPPLQVLTPERIRDIFAVETRIDAHPATGRPRFSFHLS